MKREFDFVYHLLNEEYRICFENGITKSDIENAIKDYIVKYHLYVEDDYIFSYNDKIKIDFCIDYCYNFDWSIEVNNVFLIE